MNPLLIRRRGMMAQGGGEILTPIWQGGVSLVKNQTRGTITSLGGTDFTIQSTGAGNWNLNAMAGGNTDLFQTWQDLIGNRIKVELDVENLHFVSSSSRLVAAFGFFAALTSSGARHGYKDLELTADGHYDMYLDVTADLAGWFDAGTTALTNYFSWRIYLNSASGSYATVKNVKGYIVT